MFISDSTPSDFPSEVWSDLPLILRSENSVPSVTTVNLQDKRVTRLFPGIPLATDGGDLILAYQYSAKPDLKSPTVEYTVSRKSSVPGWYSRNLSLSDDFFYSSPVLHWDPSGEVLFVHSDSKWPAALEGSGQIEVAFSSQGEESRFGSFVIDRKSVPVTVWVSTQ